MNVLFIILFTVCGLKSFANQTIVREMQVPQEFAEEVQSHGLFQLGDIVHFTASLETLNDNILHGATSAIGWTQLPDEENRKTIEGDDRGLTFQGKLIAEWGFERGSLALEFLTANYSRLANRTDEFGVSRSRNRFTNKIYTENLVHTEAKVNFVRDLNGDYFMRITGSWASLDDKGLGFDVQAFWHETFKSYEYEALEHFQKQKLYSTSLGLGKKIILKETGDIQVELELESGVEVSNIKNVARSYNRGLRTRASWQSEESTRMRELDNFAAYMDAQVSVKAFKRVKASAYTRRNTNGIKTTGVSLGMTFHPGRRYDVTLRGRVERVNNAFTKIYKHDVGRSKRTYGLDLEVRRRQK